MGETVKQPVKAPKVSKAKQAPFFMKRKSAPRKPSRLLSKRKTILRAESLYKSPGKVSLEGIKYKPIRTSKKEKAKNPANYAGLKKCVLRRPHKTPADIKKTVKKLTPEFATKKVGNVRELKKVVERYAKRPSKRSDSMNVLKRRGRLYAKATFTGYKRGLRNQYTHTSLLKIDGCRTSKDASFYVGKKCVFMYKCKNGATTCRNFNTKARVIWGKVMRTHGNTGSVRAKFVKNLPPKAMGLRVRIMLYPSSI